MALSVIKEDSCVLVTHAEESHGAMDVRVIASNNMTRGHINDVLTLVGEKAFDRILL
jgi:hypothetical protein